MDEQSARKTATGIMALGIAAVLAGVLLVPWVTAESMFTTDEARLYRISRIYASDTNESYLTQLLFGWGPWIAGIGVVIAAANVLLHEDDRSAPESAKVAGGVAVAFFGWAAYVVNQDVNDAFFLAWSAGASIRMSPGPIFAIAGSAAIGAAGWWLTTLELAVPAPTATQPPSSVAGRPQPTSRQVRARDLRPGTDIVYLDTVRRVSTVQLTPTVIHITLDDGSRVDYWPDTVVTRP
jgi:hypothetical protein